MLDEPRLLQVQLAYREAATEYERREHAREFERRLKGREPASAVSRPLRERRAPLPGLEGLSGGDEVERVAAFCARFLRHARGELPGQPLVLAEFQLEFLRELYRRDELGRRESWLTICGWGGAALGAAARVGCCMRCRGMGGVRMG